MEHVTSRVSNFLRAKNATSCLHILFWNFAVVFHQTSCVFAIFFFDEVSKMHNRLLTNQKPENMIRNCQWNCMWTIINRLKNGCETAANIKVVFIDSFKQLKIARKSRLCHKLSCMYHANMASGCTHEGACLNMASGCTHEGACFYLQMI